MPAGTSVASSNTLFEEQRQQQRTVLNKHKIYVHDDDFALLVQSGLMRTLVNVLDSEDRHHDWHTMDITSEDEDNNKVSPMVDTATPSEEPQDLLVFSVENVFE